MKLPRVPQRTTTGFAFSIVERALWEGFAKRQFGQAEIEQVLEFFGKEPKCVYCGSLEVRRWDHVVPVNTGGETVLGNIVPACSHCDDSKGNRPFDEWMLSDVKLSPKSLGVKDIDKRINRIKDYARHFGYSPRNVQERLNDDENQQIQAIRAALDSVRKDIEDLIASYRARTEED